MRSQLNPGKIALILGAVVGGFHLCWSLLVAAGWGQKVIDFILWMHFIKPIYLIEPFEFVRAALLLVFTSAIGAVMGFFAALIWNQVQSR